MPDAEAAPPSRATARAAQRRAPATGRASSSCGWRASPTAAPASPAATATSCSSRAAFPGDLVRAEVLKAKRDYAKARAVELLEPSPDRVPERCDHDGKRLPRLAVAGAALRAPARAQAGAGRRRARAARRTVGLRARADRGRGRDLALPQQDGVFVRRATERRRARRSAFTRAGSWERVENARDCVLASERSNAVRNFVRDWCAEQGLSAHDRRGGGGFLRNLVVREGRRTGDSPGPAGHQRGRLRRRRACGGGARALRRRRRALDADERRGRGLARRHDQRFSPEPEQLEEQICGLRFRISPEAFFQTNTEMAERLYELAAEYAGLGGQRARLRHLLRHRDAEPRARAALRPRSGASTSQSRRSRTRSRTRA